MPTVKNPLADFATVEDREDGVYCKINPEDKERVRLDDVFTALEAAAVLNYNAAEIRLVFFRARGIFEKVGPPFEYYDPAIESHLEFSITPEKAILQLLPSAAGAGIKITESQLTFFLNKKGVRYGIQPGRLARICAEFPNCLSVEVALGTLPEEGEDESIEYLFTVFPDLRPLLMADGRVDYREVKSFISVAAGQVLAKKTPATQGKPGMTVMGEEIPAKAGKPMDFRLGRNTELSPDGSLIISSKIGVICKEGAIIHVIELLDVTGNVDFSVGNIKYRGDVLIRGNVLPGFIIEAEGSVHVKGDVESARIVSRGGFVQVERGIFGKNDTFIWAKKGIDLSFAQEANLETEESVVFDKYLLHCECICHSLQSRDHQGSVVGGHAMAEKSVQVGQLGSDPDVKTKVTLFDREKRSSDEKLKELGELEKKLLTQTAGLQKQLRTKTALLKKFGDRISEAQLAEVKSMIDSFNAMTAKIKYVRQKIDEIKEGIERAKNKDHDGFVKVTGAVYPGTIFDMYERYFVVSSVMTDMHFKINKSEIEYGSGSA
jgi:uncharacterized protein (DUF342 family)